MRGIQAERNSGYGGHHRRRRLAMQQPLRTAFLNLTRVRRLKIARRWEQSGAREFTARSFFHFLQPIVKRAFGNSYQRDRVAIVGASNKINLEQFQAAFPRGTLQRLPSDAFKIRHVFARARPFRPPLISARRRTEVQCAHFSKRAIKPFMQSPITRMTRIEYFGSFHHSTSQSRFCLCCRRFKREHSSLSKAP